MKIDKEYIDKLKDKIQKLELSMSNPDISSNPLKMKQFMHEYADQKKILVAAANLVELRKTIDESDLLINDNECDFEIKELASIEKNEVKKIPNAEHEI